MDSATTTALQAAAMVAAGGYLVVPETYHSAGNAAFERTERTIQAVTEAIRRTNKNVRQAAVTLGNVATTKWHAGPGPVSRMAGGWPAVAGAEDQMPVQNSEKSSDVGRTTPAAASLTRTASDSPAAPSSPASDETWFYEPLNLYGDQNVPQLPRLSKSEVDNILDAVHTRRKLRDEATQHRIQRYRSGVPPAPAKESAKKNKGKKTVRFALDTKFGSTEKERQAEDKLISPIAPPPSIELDYFSKSIAVPDGSVFAHPTNEFNEADLIRRLPSQMKNGAGGLAYCRGRTEQGLYMLDTPAKRLLLDLRAGIAYDWSNGRMLDLEEVFACMLWGRGKVEEKWGAFRWSRGL